MQGQTLSRKYHSDSDIRAAGTDDVHCALVTVLRVWMHFLILSSSNCADDYFFHFLG